MSDDFLKELDEDFKDDPDYQLLSDEEKLRIVCVLEKMMDMGPFMVTKVKTGLMTVSTARNT